MSSVTKSWAPTKSDPAAAAARKKKILLVVLVVLLAAILAFEIPRLMNSSSGSASTADAAAETANAEPSGLVTDQIANAGQTAAAQDAASAQTAAQAAAVLAPTGATGTTAPATAASKKVVLAFRHRAAKDPFVPLLGETTTAPVTSPPAAPPTPSAKPQTSAATPANEEPPVTHTVTPAPPAETAPPVEPTTKATEAPAAKPATTPATTVAPPAEEPAVKVTPVKPDAAVLYTNGNKQAVAVGQYFELGDIWFQLLEVTPKTMKIAVVDGAFAGGKHAVTIDRGARITLENTATGVQYRLRFAEAAAGIATTSVPKPTEGDAAAATPAAGTTPATETPSAPATDAATTTTTTTTTSSGS